MNQILRFSGELMDVSSLSAACGLGEAEFTQWLDHPDAGGQLLLLRQYGRPRRPRFYGLDVERVDRVQSLDTISRMRHEMAAILHHQFGQRVFHWGDKRLRRLDFVVQNNGSRVDVFDCFDAAHDYSPRSLEAFRRQHPRGENYLLSPTASCPAHVRFLNMDVVTCHPGHWTSGQVGQFRSQLQCFAPRHD